MANLKTKYLGLELKNPLIAASSGLTDSVDKLKKLEDAGVGAVVLKSLFEEEILYEQKRSEQKMSNNSFIYPETVGYYEDHDNDMLSVEKYLKLITEAKKSLSIPVIPSINCLTAEEWIYFPKTLEYAGADALELNIFILPSDEKRTAEENEQVYFDIISKVKKDLKIPVAVKLSPYFSNLRQMLTKLDDAGVDALVLFNRFWSPDFDLDTMELTNARVLTDSADAALSLRWTAIMANRLKCNISASGGVADSDTFIKMMLAGADTVQVASAFYKRSPEYAKELVEGLDKWLDAKGYASVDEIRGKMSQDNSKNPAAYERVQFMKNFRGFRN